MFIRELQPVEFSPVCYELETTSTRIRIQDYIGSRLQIEFKNEKRCIVCNRKVNKLYQNGHCFPCVQTLAECDLCIVKPHECHFANGTCRDEEFGLRHCMIPHYVYIAFSSGFKVGLTRKGRERKRWVDQGARMAAVIAEVPTRKMAGELEVHIAEHMADKTNWRAMLRGDVSPEKTLREIIGEVIGRIDPVYKPYLVDTGWDEMEFVYPREHEFVPNLKSMSLDKTPQIESVLRGIKGQYLLLDDGVFNVKKHAGYLVEIA